ncbi:MAG TPA: hypothetical protein VGE04_05075 [Chloroflexia bacterium]
MAEVKDVTLTVTNALNKKKVTVDYKLHFTSADAGKKYKVAISLFGEDKQGDDEPPSFPLGAPRYTFLFGPANQFPKPYKLITADPGQESFSESQVIEKSKLNEDPGTTSGAAHPDEVYAVVSLAREARSSTVTLVL